MWPSLVVLLRPAQHKIGPEGRPLLPITVPVTAHDERNLSTYCISTGTMLKKLFK